MAEFVELCTVARKAGVQRSDSADRPLGFSRRPQVHWGSLFRLIVHAIMVAQQVGIEQVIELQPIAGPALVKGT